MKKVFSMIAVVTLLTCTFGQLALAEVGISPMVTCTSHLYQVTGETTTKYTYLSESRHSKRVTREAICVKCGKYSPNPIILEDTHEYHTWKQIEDYHVSGQNKHAYVDQCTKCLRKVTTYKVCIE